MVPPRNKLRANGQVTPGAEAKDTNITRPFSRTKSIVPNVPLLPATQKIMNTWS